MVKKNICVFCGASSGSSPDFITLAEKIGKMIGENNFNLIYGAGSTGLMGACAKSALQSGAKVFGIMPNFLARKFGITPNTLAPDCWADFAHAPMSPVLPAP